VLAIVVAWLLLTRASWFAYFMGVFLVGICDLSFTFLQVTSGIIQLNVATVSGPIIWLLAAIITPFGMPTSIRTFFREVIWADRAARAENG
jgi:hypothetical protein